MTNTISMKSSAKCGLDDALAAGLTLSDLEALVVDSVPGARDEQKAPRVAVVQSLADVEAKAIDWYWRGWLARSMLTIFGGYAGDGKSTICSALAATFSTGGLLPDGNRAPVVNSLFLSAEEDPQYALKPRLELHKANHGRVFTMRGTRDGDGPIKWADLKTDMPAIRAVVEQHRIGILWIDPISSYLPGTDRNSEGNIRDGLSGLQTLMEDTGVAVVGIAHVGKGDGTGRRAEQRLLGSTAFSALARCVWMLTNLPDEHQPESDPDNPADRRKVFGVAKANYSLFPQSLMFARPLDGPITWLGPSPVSIVEAFATKSEQGHKSRNAEEWLAERLAGGSQPSTTVEAAAKAAGISVASLKRARASLNVKSRKEATGEWVVSLPPRLTVLKSEGVQASGDSGHDKTLSALHNVSEPKGLTMSALNPFPEPRGKRMNQADPESIPDQPEESKGLKNPLRDQLSALHNEPMQPTGTDGIWRVEL